jgi:predicted dehydrogenase
MPPCRFAIVGPGFIAGVLAAAIARAEGAVLTAVASRKLENAERFVAANQAGHGAIAAVEGWRALLTRDDVDALYLATPTVAKEEIALAAVEAGKHILVDKPFWDEASCRRMIEAAHAKGLVFMDGTHFVHSPRNAAIRAAIPERIGTPRSLHTQFYFPFDGRDNIRFDPSQEPTGALGDLAWYSIRETVELLQPSGAPTTVTAVVERDPGTTAVVRIAALLAWPDGKVSSFDAGFTSGVIIMDSLLNGTKGRITQDDFVLDWNDSVAFKNPAIPVGYFHRTGMGSRAETALVETPMAKAQEALMVERFAALARDPADPARRSFADASIATQALIDRVWAAVGRA